MAEAQHHGHYDAYHMPYWQLCLCWSSFMSVQVFTFNIQSLIIMVQVKSQITSISMFTSRTWSLLNTELLKRSEHRSMSDIDVRGAEFSRTDILQQSLKGLGFNLCVVLHFNGLVVPDFGCRNKCWRWKERWDWRRVAVNSQRTKELLKYSNWRST